MSISSLSSLATTAFDTARSTIKAMADAATAPPATAEKPTTDPSAATDLGLMSLDTQDTVDVKTAWTATETPAAAAGTPAATAEEKPARPRSRLGNALDSYA